MKLPMIAALCASTLLLAGCPAFLPIAREPTIKYVLVKPDKEMTQDCLVEPPPRTQVYIESTAEEKEKLLYGLNSTQYDNIAKCNKQWQGLRLWIDKQDLIYKKK